ncbi:MAG: hypothetical protein MPW15_18280 [Candidatus Manganitrophus sp.]|nr:hypothetical protein [Candidatus Manganitrophus sp.]
MYQSLLGLLARFLPPGFAFELTLSFRFSGESPWGWGTTILFSLWPLQKVWRIAPSRVFRQEVEDSFGENGRREAEGGEMGQISSGFFSSRSRSGLGLFFIDRSRVGRAFDLASGVVAVGKLGHRRGGVGGRSSAPWGDLGGVAY